MCDTSKTIKPLRIETERLAGAVLVRLRGSVGIAQAGAMRKKLEALALRKVPTIILDLSEMDFICSAGLGGIISGHLKCRHHNGQICLLDPQPAVRQLLETTRLTKLFGVYKTLDEALNSC